MPLQNATKPSKKTLKWRKWPSFEGSPRTKRSVLNFPPLRKVLRLHVARLGADLVLLVHAGVGRRSIHSLACPLCRCSHRARRGLIEPPVQVRLHAAHVRSLLASSQPLLSTPLPPTLTYSRRISAQVLLLVDVVTHEREQLGATGARYSTIGCVSRAKSIQKL